MYGHAFMFCCVLTTGVLGFYRGDATDFAVNMLLIISISCNTIAVGTFCHPIVAKTPSRKLRYKTIAIGRVVYNLAGTFGNSLTPRMVYPIDKSLLFARMAALTCVIGWNWGAKAGLFYADTSFLWLIWGWFRFLKTKGRTFGGIDLLVDNHAPARKYKYTKVDCKFDWVGDHSWESDRSAEFAHESDANPKRGGVQHVEKMEQDGERSTEENSCCDMNLEGSHAETSLKLRRRRLDLYLSYSYIDRQSQELVAVKWVQHPQK